MFESTTDFMEKEWASDRELRKTRIIVKLWLIVTNRRIKMTYKTIHLFPAGSKFIVK
jgi:hypothetical protein